MSNEPIAVGRVEALCINGKSVEEVGFLNTGPRGDKNESLSRRLSGHDGAYIRTSELRKGDMVFNWRSWTGLSKEDIAGVEKKLGVNIPQGCLLENITFSGIPGFSKLPPTSRLVFPKREFFNHQKQAMLAVWEKMALAMESARGCGPSTQRRKT